LNDQQPTSEEQLYRLDLRYIGTPFQGWQSQTNGSGIQDHVERALATILRHPTRVVGASRTDSGVHAEHQVATFRTPIAFDEIRWLKSLNGILPPEIGVTAVQPVVAAFHPIYSARGKAYRYRLWQGATRHPMLTPYVWTLHRDLDREAMRRAAASLVGTHDFTSFCALDSSAKTRVRQVLEISISDHGPLVDIWVVGKGFLKQMIRIMVGTLVEIGMGKRAPEDMANIILAQNRDAAGITAPANGLTLIEIFYGDVLTSAALKDRMGHSFNLNVT
jgi:tRNA pseudouridine38-40 synthase